MGAEPGASALHLAYLDCEDAPKWAGHECTVPQLVVPGAAWSHFRCYRGELPPLEGLGERFAGVLVSGSHYSAHEEHAWIRQLSRWLRAAVAQHPRVRFVAMCFGCQLLAAALGGRSGRNPDGSFVLKVETLQLAPALQSSEALRLAAADAAAVGANGGGGDGGSESNDASAACGGSPPGTLRLLQSHGDQVLELPPGAVLLAHSPTAPVEMWTTAGGNVLAVQGHAELTRREVEELIHPAITAAGRLSTEEARESLRSIQQDPVDSLLVRCLFRRFLQSGSSCV